MTVVLVPAPAAESKVKQCPLAVGSGPWSDKPESQGLQERPAPFPPSLRGSPLSRPGPGDCSGPQLLGLPEPLPTGQPLPTADRAVGTSLIAGELRSPAAQQPSPRRGPGPGWAGRGGKGEQGGTPSGSREGEEERRPRRAGAELCPLLPPPSPGTQHNVTVHLGRHCGGCWGCCRRSRRGSARSMPLGA